MCLGELGVVRAIEADGSLIVEIASQRCVTVSALTLEQPAVVGDWVLSHSGFALGIVAEADAQRAVATRAAM